MRAKKKTHFFQNFPKIAQNWLFLTCLFKKLPAAQTIWSKQRLLVLLEIFLKSIPPLPPLEKILDPLLPVLDFFFVCEELGMCYLGKVSCRLSTVFAIFFCKMKVIHLCCV